VSISLDDALSATVESDRVDFKREFDPSGDGDWCEILKDIMAMGNSGGGAIVIGVDRAGTSIGVGGNFYKSVDPATVGDKIRKYTGGSDPRCTVHAAKRHNVDILILVIGECSTPVAFAKAGTYMTGQKAKCAFHEGTFYFRHNSKSEPGTTEDLARAIEREIGRRRAEWLGNIRQVMEAPAGSKFTIGSQAVTVTNSPDSPVVRLSNDPDAARVTYRSRDATHPYRFKALLAEVNKRLPEGVSVSTGELQAVRRAYQADSEPNWVDIAKYSSNQYSDAYVDWLVQQFSGDRRFGAKARMKAKRERT
jgi:Putative DNA-binding domain